MLQLTLSSITSWVLYILSLTVKLQTDVNTRNPMNSIQVSYKTYSTTHLKRWWHTFCVVYHICVENIRAIVDGILYKVFEIITYTIFISLFINMKIEESENSSICTSNDSIITHEFILNCLTNEFNMYAAPTTHKHVRLLRLNTELYFPHNSNESRMWSLNVS